MSAQQQQQFQKFRDNSVKKPIKRLRLKKSKENRCNYTQKLANNLKKRALNSADCLTSKKFNFRNAMELRSQQQTKSPSTQINPKIEEGEIIEEIESSDDDDCIVLDSPVANISILDDSSDNESVSFKSHVECDDNLPSTSRFVIDKVGEYGLSWTSNSSRTSDNACILTTDSNSTRKIVEDYKSSDSLDESVIFVKESNNEEDFIPLPVDDEPTPKRSRKDRNTKVEKTPTVMKPMNESLFTSTERKKLDSYNSNTYNPGTSTTNSNKRFIIIDGSNVAFGHGYNVFSVEGIKHCVDYFEKMGHDVKVVIPSFRRNPHKSSNPELLDQLQKDKKVVLTPCKNVLNQQSTCYDDRFILQLAYERNAAIVSNDNYRDLVHENPAFKKIIQNRVIGYSWCDDILILPKDPYGRFGPHLDEILRC